jgi:hypothetical protein
MSSSLSSPRFFNPLMLWVDVGLKTQELLLSSGSVIQLRTQRMAQAGLSPSAADLAEFQLMGQEKLSAASESGAAMVNQLRTTQVALVQRALQQWLLGAAAFFSLATSTDASQAIEHARVLGSAAARSAATASQLSSASARILQRGLKPIHAKAISNARRLGAQA